MAALFSKFVEFVRNLLFLDEQRLACGLSLAVMINTPRLVL